jgi:hypothetical protein
MSTTIQLTTDINDPETQFNNGIKMIISAYETQTTYLSNELSQLRADLKDKNAKLSKMESLCSSLLEEKTEYEFKLSALASTNTDLKKQIASLQAQLNTYLTNNDDTSNNTNKTLSTHSHTMFKSKSKTSILNGTNIDDYIDNDYTNDKPSYNYIQDNKDTIDFSCKSNLTYNSNSNNNSSKSKGRHNSLSKQTRLIKGTFIGDNSNNTNNARMKYKRRDYLTGSLIKSTVTSMNKANDLLTKTQLALQNNNNMPLTERNNVMRQSSGNATHQQDEQKMLNGSVDSDNDGDSAGDVVTTTTHYVNNNKGGNNSRRKNNNDFFKLCRDALSADEYSDMIDVIHLFNAKQIDREETYEKIVNILNNGNHMGLLREFDVLFN